MYVCMHLSIYLSIYLSDSVQIYLSIYYRLMIIYLSIYVYVCTYLCVCASVCFWAWFCVCVCVCLFSPVMTLLRPNNFARGSQIKTNSWWPTEDQKCVKPMESRKRASHINNNQWQSICYRASVTYHWDKINWDALENDQANKESKGRSRWSFIRVDVNTLMETCKLVISYSWTLLWNVCTCK